MYWVHCGMACDQRTYMVYCSIGIWSCWGTYQLRSEIIYLVVEWTGTWVKYCHRHNDFDCLHIYCGPLELWLYLDLRVQTWHNLQTIYTARRNSLYIWVLNTMSWQWDQSLHMLRVLLLPFFQCRRYISVWGMTNQLPWMISKLLIGSV